MRKIRYRVLLVLLHALSLWGCSLLPSTTKVIAVSPDNRKSFRISCREQMESDYEVCSSEISKGRVKKVIVPFAKRQLGSRSVFTEVLWNLGGDKVCILTLTNRPEQLSLIAFDLSGTSSIEPIDGEKCRAPIQKALRKRYGLFVSNPAEIGLEWVSTVEAQVLFSIKFSNNKMIELPPVSEQF